MALPTLGTQQMDAVKAAKVWWNATSSLSNMRLDEQVPYFYLGGYAGTGKSTILPVIIDAIGVNPDDVEFVAPTAKAAKVMGEKLRASGITKRPRTIHSLIYLPKPLKAEMLEKQLESLLAVATQLMQQGYARDEPRMIENAKSIELTRKDLDRAYKHVEGPRFSLNAESQILKARLVVVDEASMVGTEIAADLRGFDIPILCMGDPGQLRPVNDEPGLTGRKPDFFLSEIHRQARDNPIIALATRAREGQTLKVGRYEHGDYFAEVVERRHDKATYDESRDAQLIVGTNRKRWQVTQKLRTALGYISTGPCAGEPLLICRNSRKIPDLVNGTLVQCTKDVGDLEDGSAYFPVTIEDETGAVRSLAGVQGLLEEHHTKVKGFSSATNSESFRAKKECEHIDWGWVLTCHKAQGSQWDDVIVHDESHVFEEDSRFWLYTAVTRAAEHLTVIV